MTRTVIRITALRSSDTAKQRDNREHIDRLPEHPDLCSQPTISRLQNNPDARALLRMGEAAQGSVCEAGGMAAEGAP